jgi:hypothetical protein
MAMNKNRVIDCLIGLSVAAVVSIFIFVVLPSGAVISGPRRLPNREHFNQIAKSNLAYLNSTTTGVRNLPVKLGDSVHAAAFYLAKAEGLNDASVYFAIIDPSSPPITPHTVLEGDPVNAQRLDPDFANSTLSIVMAANFPADVRAATTPVAWTRGLQADGKWSPDSPWGTRGGYIAFIDGDVQWYDQVYANPTQGPTLTKYGTNETTTDIREALPPGAIILGAEPKPFVPENSTANPPGP